jgi:hypothetical protein
MIAIGLLLVRMLCDFFQPRPRLEAEILILRHQLNVLQQRTPRRRLHLRWIDRALFIWLYRRYPRILDALSIVRPETVLRWHRKGFTGYWRWKSRSPGGRPRIAREVRELIRRMSFENSLWGATKIHGELNCSNSASRSPSPRFPSTWYRGGIGHCRLGRPSFAIIWRGLRQLIYSWFRRLRFSSSSHVLFLATNVGSCCGLRCNPTAEWLARQITEAFPWDTAPEYLIRDNDRAFGAVFRARVRAMSIRDRPTSFRSPWQNGLVERLIGSARRECTDHGVPRTYRGRGRYGAVQKMRAGPSHPAIRSWMQTAASCCR